VLDNFSCAAKCKILLQGMFYVTNKRIYFYSPFNDKTLLGYGTKIKIEYQQIVDVKKADTLVIFPNCIKFILTEDRQIEFTSYVSRD
jgi:hypothetical protein